MERSKVCDLLSETLWPCSFLPLLSGLHPPTSLRSFPLLLSSDSTISSFSWVWALSWKGVLDGWFLESPWVAICSLLLPCTVSLWTEYLSVSKRFSYLPVKLCCKYWVGGGVKPRVFWVWGYVWGYVYFSLFNCTLCTCSLWYCSESPDLPGNCTERSGVRLWTQLRFPHSLGRTSEPPVSDQLQGPLLKGIPC